MRWCSGALTVIKRMKYLRRKQVSKTLLVCATKSYFKIFDRNPIKPIQLGQSVGKGTTHNYCKVICAWYSINYTTTLRIHPRM